MRATVIIPVYGGARFIDAAIRSVLEQDDPDLELLAYDEESTDGIVGIIQQYASKIAFWISQNRLERGRAPSDATSGAWR